MRKLEGEMGKELAVGVLHQALDDLRSPDYLRALDAFEWLVMGDGCLWSECLDLPPRSPDDVMELIRGVGWQRLNKKLTR